MSGFEILVLGSSGSYASPDNPCTGYLLRTPEANVMLDCGPGTLGPLQAAVDLKDVTAFVLTHCHPDHWLELPVIRNVFTWFVLRENVPVYGTQSTHDLDRAVTVNAPDRVDPLDWHIIHADHELTIGDQQWSFAKTDHTVETFAVRVDACGRSFAFSSDTGPGWDFRSLGSGIDLAVLRRESLPRVRGTGNPAHERTRGGRGRSTG